MACLLAIVLSPLSHAQTIPEWQDPQVNNVNTERPRAEFIPYPSEKSALAGDSVTRFVQSLNGNWKFKWASHPSRALKNFSDPGFQDSGWDVMPVPSNWQVYAAREKRAYDTPVVPPGKQYLTSAPRMDMDTNAVGMYRTTFTVTDDVKSRQFFIQFQGVQSACYVWLNGVAIGYHEDGATPFEMDVTEDIRQGINYLAVQVMSWSDGSYLEERNGWRLSGICRDVNLLIRPKVILADYAVRTNLDAALENATLKVSAFVKNYNTSSIHAHQVLFTLYDAAGNVAAMPVSQTVETLDPYQETAIRLDIPVTSPAKWSAEIPNLYKLSIQLMNSDGQVLEAVSQDVGFREVKVKGGQLILNGKPVTLTGINRAETDPISGNAVSAETMARDVTWMKQNNINAVRTTGHPHAPGWYGLCDRYGIYVIEEANMNVPADKSAGLADNPSWKPAFIARGNAMLERDKNHPSVICWSAGHAQGANFIATAEFLRLADPTRPVQTGKKDSYIPEHFTREWVSNALILKNPDGTNFWYTEKQPAFNGLVSPDRLPQSELYEAGRQFQHFRFEVPDSITSGNTNIIIANNADFQSLQGYELAWSVQENGKTIGKTGTFPNLSAAPGQKQSVTVPVELPAAKKAGAEYLLNLSVRLKAAALWAPKGFEVAWQQVPFRKAGNALPNLSLYNEKPLRVSPIGSGRVAVTGQDFALTLDRNQGIISFKNKKEEMIERGFKNIFRSENPADSLEIISSSLKTRRITAQIYRIEISQKLRGLQGEMQAATHYTVYASGDVHVQQVFKPSPEWKEPSRAGLTFQMPSSFNKIQWYGMGPHESFSGSRSGGKIAYHAGTVAQQHVAYVRPQMNGNKSGVRWAAMTNEEGIGLLAASDSVMNVNVQDYPESALAAASANTLQRGEATFVNLDLIQARPGTQIGPSGARDSYQYAFRLRPIDKTSGIDQILATSLPYLQKTTATDTGEEAAVEEEEPERIETKVPVRKPVVRKAPVRRKATSRRRRRR